MKTTTMTIAILITIAILLLSAKLDNKREAELIKYEQCVLREYNLTVYQCQDRNNGKLCECNN